MVATDGRKSDTGDACQSFDLLRGRDAHLLQAAVAVGGCWWLKSHTGDI